MQVEMMVPKRLKKARKVARLTQEEFLQLADVDTVGDKSQISKYESGQSSPPFEFIYKIAQALDYPEAYFYTLDDVFAETLLQLHRNRMDPEFNPYKAELMALKKRCDELVEVEARLNKALNISKSLLNALSIEK